MNALAPPVSLLRKLAEVMFCLLHPEDHPKFEWAKFNDAEVLEWLDRMAFLEYIPKRKSEAQTIVDGFNNTPPSAYIDVGQGRTNVIKRMMTDALEYTQRHHGSFAEARMLAVEKLCAEEDRTECGVVISENSLDTFLGAAKGYQLCAFSNISQSATFREARSVDDALTMCLEEFPIAEGFVGHYVVGIETGVVTFLDPAEEHAIDFPYEPTVTITALDLED